MRREIKIITEGQAMSGELSTTVYKTQGLTWREASFCESAIVPDLTWEKIEIPLAVCPEAGEAIAKFWRKWARDRRRERSQAKLNAFSSASTSADSKTSTSRIGKCAISTNPAAHGTVSRAAPMR